MLKRLTISGCLMIGVGLASVAQAQQEFDQVRVVGTTTPIRGKLTESTAVQITIQAGAMGVKTIPANEIVYVLFSDVDGGMKSARVDYTNGNYEAAEAQLKKMKADSLSDNGKAEYDFLLGGIAAKQALTKGTAEDLGNAGKLLVGFTAKHTNHYSYFPANEMIAELLTAMGRDATPYYTKMATAPWPEYKLKAFNASGRMLLSQGKYAEAITRFEGAAQIAGAGKQFDSQKMQAILGKAEAIAKSGQPAVAQKATEEILKNAPADDADVYARVYNILGHCHLAVKQDKDALMAFLHVDLLYSHIPDAHAEALYNLSTLWNKTGKPDRGKQARETLLRDYPNSPWSKKQG